jgi:hypothetical protein
MEFSWFPGVLEGHEMLLGTSLAQMLEGYIRLIAEKEAAAQGCIKRTKKYSLFSLRA